MAEAVLKSGLNFCFWALDAWFVEGCNQKSNRLGKANPAFPFISFTLCFIYIYIANIAHRITLKALFDPVSELFHSSAFLQLQPGNWSQIPKNFFLSCAKHLFFFFLQTQTSVEKSVQGKLTESTPFLSSPSPLLDPKICKDLLFNSRRSPVGPPAEGDQTLGGI